ncbi:MAG: hypothetical protein LUF68_07625 [Clostridiales bacterium]|nr:hypothetical protein [Clostridiales bacterium]
MKWLLSYLFAEKEKIAGLPDRRAKAEYIWQYYKLWIIGIVCGVSLLGYVIYQVNTALSENWLYVTFTNTYEEVGTGSDLWEDFVEYAGFDLSEKNVIFNNSSYFDYASNQGSGNTYYQVFVSYVDAGTLDCVTMEEDSLVALGATGRLLDLNSEGCASIVEKYGDRLVYCEPYDEEYSDDLVPVGIDVSDTCLMTEYQLYEDSCVIGIGAYSQNLDAVELFLDYLIGEAS